METINKILRHLKSALLLMKQVITWLAGFLEDQGDSASSKRLIVYVAVYYLGQMVDGMLAGKIIDNTVLWVVATIILFGIGAITSEFFSGYGNGGFNKKL